MPSFNIGDRVGAIASYDPETRILEFFGYGTYQGEEVPEDKSVTARGQSLNELQIPSPIILLESGEKIYGCECWWGSEDMVKTYIDDALEVKNMLPSDYRNLGAKALNKDK